MLLDQGFNQVVKCFALYLREIRPTLWIVPQTVVNDVLQQVEVGTFFVLFRVIDVGLFVFVAEQGLSVQNVVST